MYDKTKNNILVIGGSGFTGGRVLHSLSRRHDVQVTCLLRPGSVLRDIPEGMNVVIVRGDLDNEDSLKKAMAEKDGIIYVASLGFGHAETVVKVAENAGLKKCVFTSTTAIFTKLNANSKAIRKAAEYAIINSKLNWTIIRPTMIYGRVGDRNIERLVRYIKKYPVVFVPGDGKSLQQPNFVDDVAGAAVAAYFSANSSRKEYNLSGKAPVTFDEMVFAIANQLGKRVFVIHLSAKLCTKMAMSYESFMLRLGLKPWIKAEQIIRVNEDKSFSHDVATRDFGYNPKTFEEGVQILIDELKG